MSEGVFSGLHNAVINGIDALVDPKIALYSAAATDIAAASVTLFLLWRAYQTTAGKLQTPLGDIAWDIGRMMIILAFVTNVGNYMSSVSGMIDDLRIAVGGDSGGDIWSTMDTLWSATQTLGQHIYEMDKSTYFKFEGGLAEGLVWGGTIFTLVVSTIVNLSAELTLKFMQITGPLFIFCLMYGFLRPMFNNWLNVIFTGILTILFASLSLQIMISYLAKILSNASATVESSNMVTLGAICLLAGIGAGFVILMSAKLAGALGGASVLGAMQGAAMMGAIGASVLAKNALTSDTAKNTLKNGAFGGAAGRAVGAAAGMLERNAAGNLASGVAERSKAAVSNMKSMNK